jgi:hypothetical protein
MMTPVAGSSKATGESSSDQVGSTSKSLPSDTMSLPLKDESTLNQSQQIKSRKEHAKDHRNVSFQSLTSLNGKSRSVSINVPRIPSNNRGLTVSVWICKTSCMNGCHI